MGRDATAGRARAGDTVADVPTTRFLTAAIDRVRLEAALGFGRVQGATGNDDALTAARAVEAAARRDAGEALPLAVLARRLALRSLDEDVLLAAYALEVDPAFATSVAGIAGEEPRLGLSPKLLALLLRLDADVAATLRLDAGHPLVRAALLESHAPLAVPDTVRGWRLAERARAFLEGTARLDPVLARVGGPIELPAIMERDYAAATAAKLAPLFAAAEDVVVCLEGQEGSGRRTLVAAVAGRPVVAIDAARLSLDPVRCAAELRALRLECWLRGAVAVIARLDALPRPDGRMAEIHAHVAALLDGEQAVPGPVVVTASPGAELPELRRRLVRLRLEPPTPALRLSLWSRALADLLPAAEPTLRARFDEVVGRYGLTPGGIARAAANARAFAHARPLVEGDIRTGVTAELQERLGTLATRVDGVQTWDHVILPPDTLDDIRAFTSRAAHTAQVYDRWGFRDRLRHGLGLAALFSGAPGTGKTMVAGIIARQLGLELYAIDLSQVVSKWVGETEKQLGRIFDAAAVGNVALLFDEADSLFAKRTEVKSSNDRYANLEVNYLLQKIEAFGGMCFLTTNLEGAVDPAFRRRLAAEIRFYPPDVDERARLWRAMLPPEAPIDGALDHDALAEAYPDMCGGHIRNAVLRAAFLAAGEGTAITQGHLARAGRAEYRAMGKTL